MLLFYFMSPKNLRKIILLIIPLALLLLIVVLSIIAPILEYKRLEISRNYYYIFHNICNQLPKRCLFIYTSPMALCARCFFIYLALFITGIVLLKNKINKIYWRISLILILPCIIDGGTQYLGFRLSNNVLRSITGGLAGIGLGLIFFPLYFRVIKFFIKGGDS